VEPTSRPAPAIEHDDAIAEALQAFVCALGPAAAAVRLEYIAGVVTLSGDVASATQRQAVEDLLSAHDGVERVVSELRIVAASARAGRT
jgi:osmotically-inducible protein OsmY